MYNKIANALSIASFVLVVSSLGSAFFGYKYIQSPQFQKKIMDKVLGEVKGLLPNLLDKGLPDITGPSIPTPPTMDKLKF